MLVLGAWHELSLQYLFWGIWHGVGIAVHQFFVKTKLQTFLNKGRISLIWLPLAGFITMNYVIFSFTFTSTMSFADSIDRWKILLGVGS